MRSRENWSDGQTTRRSRPSSGTQGGSCVIPTVGGSSNLMNPRSLPVPSLTTSAFFLNSGFARYCS